jgi:hypothetical protein
MSDSNPRESLLGSFEMQWDCPHCDTKKLLGITHRHCPNCGAPQDASKRYFPSDADRIAISAHAFTGSDRLCGACQAAQSAKASHCGRCGAPLDGATAVPLVAANQPIARPSGRRWGWYVLGAVVLLSVLVWWRCIRKRTIALDVTGHSWATSIDVEEFNDVPDNAWRDQLPSGAKAVTCNGKQRSSRSVPDGESCQTVKRDRGDGTFQEVQQCTPRTRQEPIYDDWCAFSVEKWATIDQVKRTGTGIAAVVWPEPPATTGGTALGARRPGGKHAVYTLEMSEGKTRHTCEVSEATWKKYQDGQHIKAKVRASSNQLVCSSL